MSVAVANAAPVSLAKASPAAKAALFTAIGLILLCVAIDNELVAWAFAPIILAMLVFAMASAPARDTLLWLMFCGLVLENPAERPADGAWTSWLFRFGMLMQAHMNQSTGLGFMSFSGSDLLAVILMAIVWLRRSTGIDRRGRIPGPPILRKLVFISLGGTLLTTLRGLQQGGDFAVSLWQIEKVTYIPIMYLLFDAALRDMPDFIAVGKVVILAAMWRSVQACYVMWFAKLSFEPAYATSHHDSLLFATATVIVLSLLLHRAVPRIGSKAFWILVVLVCGMIANERRMVWVQIGLTLVIVYFAMPRTKLKLRIRTVIMLLSPLILAYLTVGWGTSGTGIFKPISTIKSVTQPATDLSTLTRDIENYDIVQTIRMHPWFGTGYGIGYYEIIPLPPMPHPLEPYLPHNSLLGLLFNSGFVGYTMMSLLWTVGVFFGVVAYRWARTRLERAIALPCFGIVLMYLIQCYGDIGIGSWTAVFTVAPAIAISGKLAMASGAFAPRAAAQPPAPDVRVTAHAA